MTKKYMSLDDVFSHIIDHLELVDIVSAWEALDMPSLNKEDVYTLCKRMRLKYRTKYSMHSLVHKFRDTCRCNMCGKPTRCAVLKNRRRELLCTDCAPNYLVSRNEVRYMLSTYSKEIQKKVTKTPWHTSGLKIARRAPHGGAHLYWKCDVMNLLKRAETHVSS